MIETPGNDDDCLGSCIFCIWQDGPFPAFLPNRMPHPNSLVSWEWNAVPPA